MSDTTRRIRKFYETVEVRAEDGDFSIYLDDRPARTPARAALCVPTGRLAEAIAEEWRGEGETVDLSAMMLTRLASTTIDLAAADRRRWIDEVVSYAGTDLVCYRASAPASLADRQAAEWTPYLRWAEETLGLAFTVTTGVVAVEQPDDTLAEIARRLDMLDDWRLIGAKTATHILGSAVLGLALTYRVFSAEEIFDSSRLDERFQAERWGIDAEAAAREGRLKADLMAVDRWIALLREPAG